MISDRQQQENEINFLPLTEVLDKKKKADEMSIFIPFNRSNIKRHCSHNHLYDVSTLPRSSTTVIPPPNGFTFHHSCSFDELSTAKSNRNYYFPSSNDIMMSQHHRQQWPKVIPKSPSIYSLPRNIPSPPPPPAAASLYNNTNNNIEEFDLEKLAKDFRRSHSNLLDRDYGTAV